MTPKKRDAYLRALLPYEPFLRAAFAAGDNAQDVLRWSHKLVDNMPDVMGAAITMLKEYKVVTL